MTIDHHADDSTLMSFAAGALPEALSAVVASHVAMCPRCRKDLTLMDGIGGSVLASLPRLAMTNLCPSAQATLAKDEPAGLADRAGHPKPLPAMLMRLVGGETDTIPWRRLGPGVWHVPLQLSPGAPGDLRLIKVAPGQAMPDHGHGGAELSLILSGRYTDKLGSFSVGDLADLDADVEHQPIADPDVGCICLIASEEKARFKGWVARLMQPFIGI